MIDYKTRFWYREPKLRSSFGISIRSETFFLNHVCKLPMWKVLKSLKLKLDMQNYLKIFIIWQQMWF